MTDAKQITLNLRGAWHSRYGVAPCPICQPEGRQTQNALTLADSPDGRLLLNCKKSGCSFTDILTAAGIRAGDYTPPDPAVIARREALAKAQAERKERQALSLWNEAQPIKGTIAETYLRGRGITCALADTLRFHPQAWHLTAQRFPAMLARVDGAERFAVHRTYLRHDGNGKADIEPDKAMLGATAGGAVRLSEGQDALAVGEGIETTLSLLCGLLRGPVTAWAALSTSGMSGLRLPDRPGKLIIATDGEDAGRAAGTALATRAAALGWTVSTLPAPDKRDWNDILMMKGATT
ncbi:Toprim domain-containing protein [Thalassovita litoralis]|uniref:Toprim domain-containing protein n=1 Tax=Thalassovita litoralis TaxID=1010611 RepID=A0A521FJQ8_9RHOB|nr:toprim domain-containing protein [Thalassovita litoralis]SMO96339.1 Toprim domain-containing protein [Thalassovita litoralis]